MLRRRRLDHGFDSRQINRVRGLGDDEGIQACLTESLDRVLDEHPSTHLNRGLVAIEAAAGTSCQHCRPDGGRTNRGLVATEAAAGTSCQHCRPDGGRTILDFIIRFHDLSFASTDLNEGRTRCWK